jgi:23S rRNA (guanosine2251-2'-O)-methyltransferase
MAPHPLGSGPRDGRGSRRDSGGRRDRDQPRRERDGGGEARRPQAPSEKRRASSTARQAKQSRRRTQLEAAREAVRPGQGRTLIEGRRPVVEALRAGRPMDRILLASGAGRAALGDLLDLAERRGVEVQTVPRSLIDAEARSGAHQGVLAVVAPIQPISLNELLATPLAGPEPPFLPAVAVKSSAGALEHLPVAEVPNLARAIEQLQASGIWTIGLDGTADASLFTLELADEPVCIVVGSEGTGLHRLVRDSCDLLVHIPMSGQIESLNASVAGALALFEVHRRRHPPP